MSAAMIPGYTGLLENVHVVIVAQILRIPIQEGATLLYVNQVGGPVQNQAFNTQRDAMFAAIRGLEDDAQSESKVLELVASWEATRGDLAHTEKGVRDSVWGRREEIRLALYAFYPIIPQESSGVTMLPGR